jgi:opacity protein-like surface antigen
MHHRVSLGGVLRLCSILFAMALLATLMPSHVAYGQGLELSTGWAHVTGDEGTDGFAVGGAWWFSKVVTLGLNYDDSWDTSPLTNFNITALGAVVTKSHLQNLMVGPRIFFTTDWTTKHKLVPFVENQYGYSFLAQTVRIATVGQAEASSDKFSWLLGGGAEYLFNPHWSARINLDLLRTHFADEGQSHLRMVIGLTYTFGPRGEAH